MSCEGNDDKRAMDKQERQAGGGVAAAAGSLRDKVQSLTIALQISEADRVRAETSLKVLETSSKNWDKLKAQFLLQRDELAHVRRERDSLAQELRENQRETVELREEVRRIRNQLEEATRLRLEAEQQAAAARVASAKREVMEQMQDMGMSPARSMDEALPATAPPAPTQLERKGDEDEHEGNGGEEEEEEDEEEEEGERVPPSPVAGPAVGNIALSDAALVRGAEPGTLSPAPAAAPAAGAAAAHPLSPPPALEERSAREGSMEKNGRSGALAPLVMLTSYGDQHGVKLRLTRKVEQLGGAVYVGKDFSDCVTHVVSPANAQPTVKILAGHLCKKWCVSDDWINESVVAGRFLDEHNYGVRNESDTKPFAGVTVYLHSSFLSSQEDKVKTATQLIELAGGQLIDATSNIEPTYRLVSREHGKTKMFDLLWQELLRLLTGDQQQNNPKRTTTPQPSAKKRLRMLDLSDGGGEKK